MKNTKEIKKLYEKRYKLLNLISKLERRNVEILGQIWALQDQQDKEPKNA